MTKPISTWQKEIDAGRRAALTKVKHLLKDKTKPVNYSFSTTPKYMMDRYLVGVEHRIVISWTEFKKRKSS